MTTDNQRILMYSLYGLGVVLWFVVWKLFGAVVELSLLATHSAQPEIPVFGNLSYLAAFVALGAAIGGVEYARRNATANKFGIEVVGELRKVNWPNWKEVKGTTLVVVAVSLVVATILFAFDKVYEQLLKLVY